ncbi:MAG TPA: hypothetical protein PKZ02_00670 [Candidatus Paceibacterota bacterium]|nr:hypothetical protein [Candidatus Paceibacterota bacterium]HRY76978.1 hypothetical protein [Candidatus Paceibacterota bacterium]
MKQLFRIKKSPNFWRYLVYIWTIIFYAAVIYDFIVGNGLSALLGPLAVIYIAILAIYASDKEFERWNDLHSSRHPGEMFVAGWSLLIIILLLGEFIFQKAYDIPDVLIYTYITVLSILAITRKSRSLYEQKKDVDDSQGKLMV